MLVEALSQRFGSRVLVKANDSELLTRLSPTGSWRTGSFEIVQVASSQKLYSKLETRVHLVSNKSAFSKWLDTLASRLEE